MVKILLQDETGHREQKETLLRDQSQHRARKTPQQKQETRLLE